MPQDIINKFKDEYGDKAGEKIFYATANKQGRDKETFKKESTNLSDDQLDVAIKEAMNQLSGVVADPLAPETPNPIAPIDPTAGPTGQAPMDACAAISLTPVAPINSGSSGLPETVPGEVVPPMAENTPPAPPINSIVPPVGNVPAPGQPTPNGTLTGLEKDPANPGILNEKKDKENEKAKEKVKEAGKTLPREGNKHMPKAKQVHKSKKDKKEKHKKPWEKFEESVNQYISKTSRKYDIGIGSLENIWKECVEAQAKGEYPRSSRKFWVEVRTKFDKHIDQMFLAEAKSKMTERQNLGMLIEKFLGYVASNRYVEAKPLVKQMAESCVKSMVSDRKVDYQKALAEEISKKIREAK
jgi:hypothetical protein